MRKVAELAQFYYKKRKPPPPKKPQQKQGWGSIVALLGVLVTIAAGVQAWCYHRYGPLFFWSAESKQLDLTPNAWRALLETRSVAFIGGHHRAGTTQLWRSVARHPDVASFGEQRDCGLDFSEGIFAQDVYPRFGVGEMSLGSSSQKNTGLGRYALGAVEEVSDEKTFKKILAENPAVVVDFYSQTCGPCIMMAPVFKDAAKELERAEKAEQKTSKALEKAEGEASTLTAEAEKVTQQADQPNKVEIEKTKLYYLLSLIHI